MAKIISLSKVCVIDSIYNMFHFNNKGKKTASILGAIICFVSVLVLISVVLSFPMAKRIIPYGGEDILLLSLFRIAIILSIAISLFTSHGFVFVISDIDTLWSMPISKYLIFFVRISAIYLESLAIILILMIPTGIACIVYSSSIKWILLNIIFTSFFLAFIPAAIAIVGGGLIGIVSSRIGINNILTSILGILTVVGIFLLVVTSSFSLGGINENTLNTSQGIRNLILPIDKVVDWMIDRSGISLIYLILICLSLFFVTSFVIGSMYESILIRMGGNNGAFTLVKNKNYVKKGVIRAIWTKEAQCFWKTPIYIMNCGIGAVTLICATIYALIIQESTQNYLFNLTGIIMDGEAKTNIALPLLMAAMSFVSVRINSASASINMELDRIWIIKVAPVNAWKIYIAKISFNLLTGIPVQIISSIGLGIAFKLSKVNIIILLAFMVLLQIFIAVLGIVLNLIFPKTDAGRDVVAVRDGISVILSRFITLGIVGLGGSIYYFIYRLDISFISFIIGFMGIILLIILALVFALLKNGEKWLLSTN